MMVRKGQAALEFLTTYGWAFLVILAMIGALAYFGVLNPSRFLPEKCLFPTGLECTEHFLTYNESTARGHARVYLNNNLGRPLQNFTMSARYIGETAYSNCNVSSIAKSGERFQVVCWSIPNPPPGTAVGARTKLTFNGSYLLEGDRYWNTFDGEIYGTNQAWQPVS